MKSYEEISELRPQTMLTFRPLREDEAVRKHMTVKAKLVSHIIALKSYFLNMFTFFYLGENDKPDFFLHDFFKFSALHVQRLSVVTRQKTFSSLSCKTFTIPFFSHNNSTASAGGSKRNRKGTLVFYLQGVVLTFLCPMR